jgi:hypothetical protein
VARIQGRSERGGGPLIRATYIASRRTLRRMLGQPDAEVMEPLALHAHRQWLMAAFGAFELALQRSTALDFTLKELARARVGMLHGCPW